MFGFIPVFLLNPPARLKVLGQALAHSSFILVMVGLYLRIGVVVMSTLPMTNGINKVPATLAAMYPTVSTWFLPESTLVFAILICAWALGVYISFLAKKIERIFRR